MASVDLGIEGLSGFQQVGAGGFAVVYSAVEEGAGRQVAVKVLHSVNDAGRRRFERECRTMGRTTGHPNIVTMFRFGFTERDSRPFLVMEYLDGGSLLDKVDRSGPFPLDEAISITTDIADALRFSHNSGILHKDVKPGNILLSSSGRAKLTDFGIAAVQEATDASLMAFSIAYAAPESFTASTDPVDGTVRDPRDQRSDLYSLAVTLHVLVTGRSPFEGPNQVALMRQIVDTAPPPTGHTRLDRFLAVALAKDPDDRFPDADAFIGALARIQSDGDGPDVASVQVPVPTDGLDLQPTSPLSLPNADTLVPTPGLPAIALGPTTPGLPEPLYQAEAPGPSTTDSPQPERRPGLWALSAVVVMMATAVAGLSWRLLNRDDTGAGPAPTEEQATDTTVEDETTADEVTLPADSVYTGHRDRAGDPAFDGVVAVIQLGDGRLVSAGSDGSAQVWNPADPAEPPLVHAGHDEAVQALAALTDGRVASASSDGTVNIWDPDAPDVTIASYNQHRIEADDPGEDGIASVIQLSDGRMASAGGFGTVHLWDPERVDLPPVVYSGHRDRAADEDIDGVVEVIELATGLLASAGNDGSVQVWDPNDPAAPVSIYEGHTDRVLAVSELPDGRLLSAGADNTVQVWDPADPSAVLATYRGHDERVLAIAPLADGLVASAGSDGTVQIWDPDEPGTPIRASYARHRDEATDPDEDAVADLALLADGRIASASADGTVRLWIP